MPRYEITSEDVRALSRAIWLAVEDVEADREAAAEVIQDTVSEYLEELEVREK